MKTNLKITAGFIMVLFAANPISFAEWIDGEVTSVNKANQTIEVRKFDERGQSKVMTVKVDGKAQWKGYRDLNSLKNGDRVRLDVNHSFFGGDKVKAVNAGVSNAAAKANAQIANIKKTGVQTTAAANAYVPGPGTIQAAKVTGPPASVGGIGASGSVNSDGGTLGASTTGVRTNAAGVTTGLIGRNATTGTHVQGATGIQGKVNTESGSPASQTTATTNE